MINFPFLSKKKKFLGIDIGTSSTRVVELSYSEKGGNVVLENYGEKTNKISKEDLYSGPIKKDFIPSSEEVAGDIKKILSSAEIKNRKASFSIPSFATFFTVFKVPVKPEEDITSAIQFEAKQHIPFPIEEVDLDWSVIEESETKDKTWSKVLLVAVPKKTISKYKEIAKKAEVEFLSIEPEVFSLSRASAVGGDSNKVLQFIDIGIQSTTISIVENGVIKSTHNSDFSEREIARNLVSKLGVSYNEADEMRRNIGFIEGTKEGDVMCEHLDVLVKESKQITDNFLRTENKQVQKNLLYGGPVMSPGLEDFIKTKTGRETCVSNPFLDFSYPSELKEVLKEIGPRYAIAAGLALRNRE